jgi:thiol-disulfide isomerase/thioredoxin
MKKKLKHYLKEILFFIIAMTIIANLLSLYKSQNLNEAPLRLATLTLIDNTVYKFPSDKPVLIHFWATWCPTCKLEAANIEFISKHFEVVTIAVDSGTSAKLRAYIKEKNYTYRVVNDSLKHLSKEFNIAGFPTTFIYDKNKKLIFSEVGYTSIIGLYLRMWWASF